jgi:SpoIVB peptidase S55
MNGRSVFGRQHLASRPMMGVAVVGVLGLALATGVTGSAAAAGGAVPAPSAGHRAAAAGLTQPIDCPGVQPVSGVRTGMRGTGFTVTRGTKPQPFDVEVLGVLPNAVVPGHDLVLVQVADKPGGPRVIAQGGGIWAGMSGSPVYIGDKLLGSVSYSLTAAPSPIGGVTPAEDMVKLLRSGTSTRAQAAAADPHPSRIVIPEAMRRQIAARTGTSVTSTTLRQVRVPMGVSGLTARRVAQLQTVTDRAGLSVLAYPAGSAPRPTAATARPRAGGNFAAVLSYGDVSLTGVGTTTMVCGGRAVAFGHPLAFFGDSAFGANGANSLVIVQDPSVGSFKLATVGPAYGTLNVDRFSGVRTALGQMPPLIPLRTTVRSVSTGRTLQGRTDTTDDRFLSTATLFHVIASIESGFDQVGVNHSRTSWTITGTRAKGRSFSLTRTNRWADLFDPTIGPSFELAAAEDTLLTNEHEAVRIRDITFRADLSPRFDQETVVRRLVAVNGGALKERGAIAVRRGDRIHVRILSQPYRSSTVRATDFTLRVPAHAPRGDLSLDVTAGIPQPVDEGTGGTLNPGMSCLLQPGVGCARPQAAGQSFDTVLSELRATPQNNALTVSLSRVDADGTVSEPIRSSTKLLNRVVTGELESVAVTVR